ncbi:hypothetical protein [Vallitalea okinawensis]|uniref:hypothetical protein n=1 Tax=Vallitalea okinawensis TaxID=2078660 RepID=UPI00130078D7|nr:hypothetical protein [Vallitalea okinawensis]
MGNIINAAMANTPSFLDAAATSAAAQSEMETWWPYILTLVFVSIVAGLVKKFAF